MILVVEHYQIRSSLPAEKVANRGYQNFKVTGVVALNLIILVLFYVFFYKMKYDLTCVAIFS